MTQIALPEKVKYDFPFTLIVVLALIGNIRPDRLIPGLSSLGVVKQIPNVLTGLLFLVWLLQNRKVLHNAETKLYIAFLLLMVLGTGLARNPALALAVTKGFSMGVAAYLANVAFVDSLPKLRILLQIFLVCDVPIALLGILGGGRIMTIPALSDENDFALLMNVLVPFAFFFGLKAHRTKERLLYYGMFFLYLAGVVVSLSRGGFLGLLCTLAYCFTKTTRKGMVVSFGLLLVLLTYFFVPQSYWDEMRTIQTEGASEGTGEARIYYWENALKIFAHHPLIGVGPANSGVWITTYDPSERGMRDWGRALHSLYFTLLAEQGIAGTFLFLAMIYYSERDKRELRSLWEKERRVAAKADDHADPLETRRLADLREGYYYSLALTGGLIGYLSSGAFLSVLYYPWFWTILGYTVILSNLLKVSVEGRNTSDQVRGGI